MKAGDRVRVVADMPDKGEVGTIEEVTDRDTWPVHVLLDNFQTQGYGVYDADELEVIEEGP